MFRSGGCYKGPIQPARAEPPPAPRAAAPAPTSVRPHPRPLPLPGLCLSLGCFCGSYRAPASVLWDSAEGQSPRRARCPLEGPVFRLCCVGGPGCGQGVPGGCGACAMCRGGRVDRGVQGQQGSACTFGLAGVFSRTALQPGPLSTSCFAGGAGVSAPGCGPSSSREGGRVFMPSKLRRTRFPEVPVVGPGRSGQSTRALALPGDVSQASTCLGPGFRDCYQQPPAPRALLHPRSWWLLAPEREPCVPGTLRVARGQGTECPRIWERSPQSPSLPRCVPAASLSHVGWPSGWGLCLGFCPAAGRANSMFAVTATSVWGAFGGAFGADRRVCASRRPLTPLSRGVARQAGPWLCRPPRVSMARGRLPRDEFSLSPPALRVLPGHAGTVSAPRAAWDGSSGSGTVEGAVC